MGDDMTVQNIPPSFIGLGLSLDLPPFDPEVTGMIAREGNIRMIQTILITGKALHQGKEKLLHGEYEKWVQETTWMSLSSARKYSNAYERYRENPELFNLTNGNNEIQKKVLLLSEKDFLSVSDSSSSEELENKLVKLKAETKLLKMEKAEWKDEQKSGREKLEELEHKNYDLEKTVDDLKNPKMKQEETIRHSQSIVNDIVMSLIKLRGLDLPVENRLAVQQPIAIEWKNLNDAWSPQWEDSHK